MKRLILYLLSPLLFIGCSEEKYPALAPYIYFTSNVDYYVVDPDATPAYTITGSFNAEGMIARITIDGTTYTEEEIGAELTTHPLSYEVDLTTIHAPRTVEFVLEDKRGGVVKKDFNFLPANPVETYDVELGAQNNGTTGFFFSLEDYQVYSVSEFLTGHTETEGICFGFNKGKNEALLLSPTALVMMNILQNKGTKLVSLGSVNIPGADFVKIENDAAIKNLVGSSFRTFEYITAKSGTSYLFKTASGRWGLLYIQEMRPGLAGNVKLLVKIQKD